MQRVWKALYAKVRAYLLGGTAAAGVSGGVLWIISQGLAEPMPIWLPGLVTALAAQAIGLFVAYQKVETGPAGGGQVELAIEADEDLLPAAELGAP